MNRMQPLSFAVCGVSLVVVGILAKSFPLLDQLANISFPYLAGMLGLVVLVVGIHCLVFASSVRNLPLWPNLILFAIIAGAANINIVWDGIVIGYTKEDIWLNVGNSLEFSLYYATFLFLPRFGGTARIQVIESTQENPDSDTFESVVGSVVV